MENKVPENPSKNRSRDFNALVVVSCLLVTLYLTANLMAVKIIRIGSGSLVDAGTLAFSFHYMLGDVLAEVWGYRTARKVVFLTFLANFLLVIFTAVGVILPYPDYMQPVQEAYSAIYTYVPRIVAASLISFLLGELSNAKALVLIKRIQKKKERLWVRTVGSSMVGYLFDTVLFVLLAFSFTVPAGELAQMIIVQYAAKLVIEMLAGTPLAYAAVRKLAGGIG